MAKRDYIDFQDRTSPLGYLITFPCYGTWLHGEERGSVDRRRYNRYGTPDMPPNIKVLEDEETSLNTRASSLIGSRGPLLHRLFVKSVIIAATDYMPSMPGQITCTQSWVPATSRRPL